MSLEAAQGDPVGLTRVVASLLRIHTPSCLDTSTPLGAERSTVRDVFCKQKGSVVGMFRLG